MVQVDINMYLTDEQKQLLIDNGFEGTDVDLDVSLFEYGLLYSTKREIAIYCISDDGYEEHGDYIFDFFPTTKEEIEDVLESMSDGFYSWLGCTDKEKCYNKDRYYPTIVYDINQYNGDLRPHSYSALSLEEMFERLKEALTDEE